MIQGRVLPQQGFDLAQLDPIAPQLDLVVDAAEVFQVAVRQMARQVAAALDDDFDIEVVEMQRNGTTGMCCGAGGAQMWKEEEHGTEAVSLNRFKEAHNTGAETLAVGCPFCMTMMKDANTEEGNPMQVKDVAQIVVEAMGS